MNKPPNAQCPQGNRPIAALHALACYVMESGASAEIAVVGNVRLVGIALFMGGQTVTTSCGQQSCRWLLLSLDRLQGNERVMTQELIANMVGVRREGVTETALQLKKAGPIHCARGHITVIARAGLEDRTCEYDEVVKRVRPAAARPDGP